jgi:urease accessory protein
MDRAEGTYIHMTRMSTGIRNEPFWSLREIRMGYEGELGRSELGELRLLHLADSALPIGGLAHSLGLESLVAAELVGVRELPEFLRGFLEEAGFLEAVFCRAGFRLGSRFLAVERPEDRLQSFARDWLALNERLGAMKPARESRSGSASLGRNFLAVLGGLGDFAVVREALRVSKDQGGLIHHSVAFGLGSGVLKFEEDRAVLAFLHSCAASLVSACQRLLPLGQNAATRILWELKPAIVEIMRRSAGCSVEDAWCFMPLLDWGGMEHPALAMRLFIS